MHTMERTYNTGELELGPTVDVAVSSTSTYFKLHRYIYIYIHDSLVSEVPTARDFNTC